MRRPQTGVPELGLRSTGSRVRLPVSTTRLMLLVAMRRLLRRSWTGRVLVLADEPSPAAQHAGRRNRAAGEGNPLCVAAGPRAAMLEATGKGRRQASRTLRVVDSGERDTPAPSCGQGRGPLRDGLAADAASGRLRDTRMPGGR